MKIETLILAAAIVLTGIMTGIFFTWSNAVTPGIGKLSDTEYLRALQSMNRVILNNAFIAVFSGAMLAAALVPVVHWSSFPKAIFWLYAFAFIVYATGVFGVTIMGNIPLNDMLEGTDLDSISELDAQACRTNIEVKWNTFNLIRSVSSALTFIVLTASYLLHDPH